jgi:hypothetical protein
MLRFSFPQFWSRASFSQNRVNGALHLVRADGTLHFGSVQNLPLARAHLGDVLGALDFVISRDYPARGEVEDLAQAPE